MHSRPILRIARIKGGCPATVFKVLQLKDLNQSLIFSFVRPKAVMAKAEDKVKCVCAITARLVNAKPFMRLNQLDIRKSQMTRHSPNEIRNIRLNTFEVLQILVACWGSFNSNISFI